MRETLESVIAQTARPTKWVIVDDGSTDNTPKILHEYANNYDFIEIISRKDRGHRKVGPGVIEAFYEGYNKFKSEDYDYICKLDLDLRLPRNYFQLLLERMKSNPRIGTCSGKPYYIGSNSKHISEKCGDENSVGMTKLYRHECFKDIGGFIREVMWDGIDGHRCRMNGWIAISWDDPDLRFIHLRPMGSSQKNWLTGRMRHGYGQYFMGTGFLYMTISSIYRMFTPPYIIGGGAMWWGYIKSFLKKDKRLNDETFRKFLRKYQWNCLVKGKSKATQELNSEQANILGILPNDKHKM